METACGCRKAIEDLTASDYAKNIFIMELLSSNATMMNSACVAERSQKMQLQMQNQMLAKELNEARTTAAAARKSEREAKARAHDLAIHLKMTQKDLEGVKIHLKAVLKEIKERREESEFHVILV